MMRKLTTRELLFCMCLVQLQNPLEAAIRAGYSSRTAHIQAARLLTREEIRGEVERQQQAFGSGGLRQSALKGLCRLAFGMANDAATLVLNGESVEDLHKLDLFGVAEIRRPKGGGVEVRFFDRLRALDLLLHNGNGDASPVADSFYQALEKGAEKANEGSRRSHEGQEGL